MTKLQQNDDIKAYRDELTTKIEDAENRLHKEFSKLLDDTTQIIEDSINQNLVSQMKELDHAL